MTRNSHSADPDHNCVQRAQRGDRGAVRTLYEKYFEPLYRFCYWQTGSQADAEDITQDVFIAMTISLRSFRGDALFKNWLYQMAKNKVAQWITRKRNTTHFPLLEEIEDTSNWIDPENEQFKRKVVKKLLSALKPRERKVIELRYLKRYSVEETAKAIHITPSNVKVITHRVLLHLRSVSSDM